MPLPVTAAIGRPWGVSYAFTELLVLSSLKDPLTPPPGHRGEAEPSLLSSNASISVALCTCNGQAYLEEQLESIGMQSMSPTEMVIFDDASSDASVNIIHRFAAAASFPVLVHVNERNMGVSRNFQMAIEKCESDVVVLADQDDVWAPHKIRLLYERLRMPDRPVLVFSDAAVVDQDLEALQGGLFSRIGFSRRERRRFASGGATEVLLRHNVVTGATMAFRSSVLGFALPIPTGWVHDEWIALVASLLGKAAFIEEPLLQYRQHETNVIGARKNARSKLSSPRNSLYEALQGSLSGWDRAIEIASQLNPDYAPLLRKKREHVCMRIQLPNQRLRRLPYVLKGLLSRRYHRYGRGVRTAVLDMAVS